MGKSPILSLFVASLAVACAGEGQPLASSAPPGSSAAAGTSPPRGSTSAAGAPSTSAPQASASAAKPAERPLPARAPGELAGETIDFPFDGKTVDDPTQSYEGRVFITDRASVAAGPVPLVVFFHGLNRALIPHRWMGGGDEGDVRRIAGELVSAGAVAPLVLAGPGSIEKAAVSGGASFPTFDFDRFVDLTEKAVGDRVKIDRERVVVLGHSGAGCSAKGGIVSATASKLVPLAVVSIDTCMPGSLADALGRAGPKTHVVVTWQTATWDRGFDHFRAVFDARVKEHPAGAGVLRELDSLPNLPRSHDATVKQTFDKWLPRLLPPPKD